MRDKVTEGEEVKKMREETIGQEKIFANYISVKEKKKNWKLALKSDLL